MTEGSISLETLTYMNTNVPYVMTEFYGYVYAFRGGIPAFKTRLWNCILPDNNNSVLKNNTLIARLIKSQMFPPRPLNSMGSSTGSVQMI